MARIYSVRQTEKYDRMAMDENPITEEISEEIWLRKFKIQNPNFLMNVRRELKKIDPKGTGLTTANKFNDIIESMGIGFGKPEMDLIMRYCIVTPDEYVITKPLLLATTPIRPHQQDNVRDSLESACGPSEELIILPSQNDIPDIIEECRGLTSEKSIFISKVFRLWERCLIKDHQMKRAFKEAGIACTPELDRLLASKGASGCVTLGEIICAVSARDITTGRKNRSNAVGFDVAAPLLAAGREVFNNPWRNPITWDEVIKPGDCQHFQKLPWINDDKGKLKDENKNLLLSRLCSEFANGELAGGPFRIYLNAYGVDICHGLNRLIRSQESGNDVSFSKILTLVLRGLKRSKKHDVPSDDRL